MNTTTRPRSGFLIPHPGPGRAVMTCPRCRRIVDRDQLVWFDRQLLLLGCTGCTGTKADPQ